jgi:hypothetical protein
MMIWLRVGLPPEEHVLLDVIQSFILIEGQNRDIFGCNYSQADEFVVICRE